MPPKPGRAPLLVRAIDGVAQIMNIAGSGLILMLMVLIGVDVAGRNLFGAPVPGVPEIVSLSIVAIVFLQGPQTLRAGRLTRSDALINRLGIRFPMAGRLLHDLWDVAGASLLAVVAYATWPTLLRDYDRGTFVGAIGDFTAPLWPVKAMIVLGSAMLALVFLASIWRRHRLANEAV